MDLDELDAVLLVYAALKATSVCGLKLLVYAAFSS
jgi:hypothetical protein